MIAKDVIPAQAGIQGKKTLDARLRISGMTEQRTFSCLLCEPMAYVDSLQAGNPVLRTFPDACRQYVRRIRGHYDFF